MRVVASGLTGREVTAAMPVTIYCPNLLCCRLLQAPDQSRGDLVACEVCGATFLVPLRPLPPPPDHACEDEPTEEARAEEMSLTFAFDADLDEDAGGHEVVHFPIDRRSLLSPG